MRFRMGRIDGSRVMGRGFGTILLLWVFGSSIGAKADGIWRYDFTLGTDYRRAQLDWNIAGSLVGTSPNVLSELTWYDLDIAQISAVVQAIVKDRLVFRGSGAIGAVVSGNVRDSDYGGDNRSLEYLRSISKGNGGIGDGSVGFGYRIHFSESSVRHNVDFTPMVGYSRHLQYLKIRDGRQIIPPTGPIANLDSNYNADWSGPWLGMNVRVRTSDRTAVIIDTGYHWVDYYAEANWNLRDDLTHPVSFKHNSQGNGFTMSLALSATLTRHWDVLARLEVQDWRADPGFDTLYIVDSTTKAVQPTVTRLNEVNWRSLLGGIAATYHF